jgi:RimJ/RimL family protein N-acetyltransferase
MPRLQRHATTTSRAADRRTAAAPTAPATAVTLRHVSAEAAAAVLEGRRPPDVPVAEDYPTEFSHGIVRQAGGGSPLGPFFIHRATDDVVVGEIGGGFVGPGTVEIGYAIVASCQGLGHATEAVRQLITVAQAAGTIDRLIAHTPLDRPASGRVVAKAGLSPVGEVDDEHEGVTIRVTRWELTLPPES